MKELPAAGLVVIELGEGVAASHAELVLAGLGAEVSVTGESADRPPVHTCVSIMDRGGDANMAKLQAADAAWEAAEVAIQTFYGFAYATEYDIERKWREIPAGRTAPISVNLSLIPSVIENDAWYKSLFWCAAAPPAPRAGISNIGQHGLGMPRSY